MKRILSAMLAAMMILSLAGCSNDTESELREEIDRLQDEIDDLENDRDDNIIVTSDADTNTENDNVSTPDNNETIETVTITETETVEPEMYYISATDDFFSYERLEDGGVEIHLTLMPDTDIDNWHVTYPLELGGSPVVASYMQTDWPDQIITVEFEDGYTRIPAYAIQGAKSLETVIIPNTVIEIGKWAFSGCESLTSVEIPDDIKFIGPGAFDPRYDINVTYRGKTYSVDELEQLTADVITNNPDAYDANGNYITDREVGLY